MDIASRRFAVAALTAESMRECESLSIAIRTMVLLNAGMTIADQNPTVRVRYDVAELPQASWKKHLHAIVLTSGGIWRAHMAEPHDDTREFALVPRSEDEAPAQHIAARRNGLLIKQIVLQVSHGPYRVTRRFDVLHAQESSEDENLFL